MITKEETPPPEDFSLPPGSAPIYTHSLEYMHKYNENLKSKQPPQSADVMTLRECKEFIADELGNESFSEMLYWRSSDRGFSQPEAFDKIAELYASQFKAKYDQLQAELEQVKSERDEMYEALKMIRFFPFNSVIHPSIQGEKAIEIANKALQSTKQ